jgi:phosphonate transport system substrate-binding protein
MKKLYAAILLFLMGLGMSTTPNSVRAEDGVQMAIFPRKSFQETAQAYGPLAEYLSRKINKKVELVVFPDFPTFWERLVKNQYDLVHFNQYHYVKTHKELGYQVLLMNEEFHLNQMYSAIIVRKDSNITNVTDLKGKKIIFGGGKQAMVSYIGARYLLQKEGLNPGDYVEEFSINPPNAVVSVFKGLAPAAGSGEVTLEFFSIKDRVDVSQLKVLARGEPLPMLPWAVRKGMDPLLAEQIKQAMIDLRADPRNRIILEGMEVTGFIPVTDRQYDVVRRIILEVLNENY